MLTRTALAFLSLNRVRLCDECDSDSNEKCLKELHGDLELWVSLGYPGSSRAAYLSYEHVLTVG